MKRRIAMTMFFTLGAVGLAALAPDRAAGAACGFAPGGPSAGSVTVEAFTIRVSRAGPESSRKTPIDRKVPARVEFASFGLG